MHCKPATAGPRTQTVVGQDCSTPTLWWTICLAPTLTTISVNLTISATSRPTTDNHTCGWAATWKPCRAPHWTHFSGVTIVTWIWWARDSGIGMTSITRSEFFTLSVGCTRGHSLKLYLVDRGLVPLLTALWSVVDRIGGHPCVKQAGCGCSDNPE